jgi:hypothetical protein
MAIAAASADGKDVFGKNGLFDELKKALAERMRMVPRLMSSGGFGHLSKNDFMLSRSTASVWPDEAAGHDRDRLPVRSRLALRAQRQWRPQSQPW